MKNFDKAAQERAKELAADMAARKIAAAKRHGKQYAAHFDDILPRD